MLPHKVAITGFMCSGKTTVARALGQILGCEVIDLDEAILVSEGRKPADIIEQDGEHAFRQIETGILAPLLSRQDGCVISLGGGTWTLEQNRRLLSDYGYTTVWLDAPFELCWKRIEDGEERRPLAESYESARERYQERLAKYELAQLRVKIKDAETVDDLANRIVAAVLQTGENS